MVEYSSWSANAPPSDLPARSARMKLRVSDDSGMSSSESEGLPIDGGVLSRAGPDDAAELLVLQRCCWVEEALANDTLDIAALHESLDDVRAWLDEWATWCVRIGARLVGAVRARQEGQHGTSAG